jgi:predicted RNA binding protein YcfA (HicA-like mRNA interferase family)
MKSFNSREVIKLLEEDGWFEVGKNGSHRKFNHLYKEGMVIVPHPKKNLPIGTLKSILRQARITLK